MRRLMTRFTMAVAALSLVATGCGDDGPAAVPANASDAMANYADIVYASYLDSHTAAVALKLSLIHI